MIADAAGIIEPRSSVLALRCLRESLGLVFGGVDKAVATAAAVLTSAFVRLAVLPSKSLWWFVVLRPSESGWATGGRDRVVMQSSSRLFEWLGPG